MDRKRSHTRTHQHQHLLSCKNNPPNTVSPLILFLVSCKQAKGHWYAISDVGNADGGEASYTTMAQLFGITQEAFEALLVHLGFGRQKQGAFQFLEMQYKKEMDKEPQLGSEDSTVKRYIASVKRNVKFLRIGGSKGGKTLGDDEDTREDPGFRGPPPRVPGLRESLKQFKETCPNFFTHSTERKAGFFSMVDHDAARDTNMRHNKKEALLLDEEDCIPMTIEPNQEEEQQDDRSNSKLHEEESTGTRQQQQEPIVLHFLALVPELFKVKLSQQQCPEGEATTEGDDDIAHHNLEVRAGIDPLEIESAVLQIARDILIRRERKVSKILDSSNNNKSSYQISPRTLNNELKYPRLRYHGIPLNDKRVQMLVLREIHMMHQERGEQHQPLAYNLMTRGGKTNLVEIPTTSSYTLMKRYAKEREWVRHMLVAMAGGKTDEEVSQSCIDLLTYFAKHPDYSEEFSFVAGKHCTFLMQPRIDAGTTLAIQQICNISNWQMRLLRDCLKRSIGCHIFESAYKILKIVNVEAVDIIEGMHKEGTERVPYVYRKLPDVLLRWLQTMHDTNEEKKLVQKEEHSFCQRRTGSNVPPPSGAGNDSSFFDGVHVVDVVLNLDHGQGNSRISANFIVRRNNDNDHHHNQEEDDDADLDCVTTQSICLGNAHCRRDNTSIIQNTFGMYVDDDMKYLAKMGSAFTVVNGKVTFIEEEEHENATTKMIKIEVFLSSDLLLYTYILGKGGSAGYWCPYCDLGRLEWQSKDHRKGDAWTIERLQEHSEFLFEMYERRIRELGLDRRSDRAKFTRVIDAAIRKGVNRTPVFREIPIERFVVPRLHILLGKGNDILKYLIDAAQNFTETFTDEYLKAETDVATIGEQMQKKKLELRGFQQSYSYYMADLSKRYSRDDSSNEANPPSGNKEGFDTDDSEDLDLTARLELEELQHREMTLFNSVRSLKRHLDSANEKFEAAKKDKANSKELGQPVLADIEQILRVYGIDRSNMFGGSITGNACRRLMSRNVEILNDILELCINHPSQIPGKKQSFLDTIEGIKMYLDALDGLLSVMATKRFQTTHMTFHSCIEYRDKFIEIERYLGMSITPKSHVLEDHLLEQMILFKGIGDLDEEFGERMHKDQTKANDRLGSYRGFHKRERQKIVEEDNRAHPTVRTSKDMLTNGVKVEGGTEGPAKKKRKPNQKEVAAHERDAQRQKRRAEVLCFQKSSNSKPLESMRSIRKRVLSQGPSAIATISTSNSNEVAGPLQLQE